MYTVKTGVFESFKEKIPEIKEKIIDYMFSIVSVEDLKSKRKYEIPDKLREVLSGEYRSLLNELEDLILAIECERLEKAIFYVLDSGNELKRAVIGF